MTNQSLRTSTVTGEWVIVERSVAAKEAGVVATVTLTSSATAPVVVRISEVLPDSWNVNEVGIHPENEPRMFTAETHRIEIADVVDPAERLQFVYGVRVDHVEALEPLAPTTIAIERLVAADDDPTAILDRIGPTGPPEQETPSGPVEPHPDSSHEARRDSAGGASAIGDEFTYPNEGTPGAGSPAQGTPPSDYVRFLSGESDDPSRRTGNMANGDGRTPSTDVDTGSAKTPSETTVIESQAEDSGSVGTEAPTMADGLIDDPSTVAGDGGLVEALPAAVADEANLLILSDHTDTATGCAHLLERQSAPDNALLLVSFLETVDDQLDDLRAHGSERCPSHLICMGDQLRPDASDTASSTGPAGNVSVSAIADSTDLFRLGVHVDRSLEQMDGHPMICLHTLTALVGLVDLQRAFRFLHVLSGRVRQAGGQAHYHLDPAAVDERTLATLRPLFDRVVRYEDGHWRVE